MVLPKGNQRDFEELPDYLRPKDLEVHFAEHYDEVLKIALLVGGGGE